MAARRQMLPNFHPQASSDARNSFSALDREHKDVIQPLIQNRTTFSGNNSNSLLNNDIQSSDSNSLKGIFADRLHGNFIFLLQLFWYSARLALMGTQEKEFVTTSVPIASERICAVNMNPTIQPLLENELIKEANLDNRNCEPIIEEPATPEEESPEALEHDIEDLYREDPDEIPIIKLQNEVSSTDVWNNRQEYEKPEGDMSMALVELDPQSAYIPEDVLKI